MTSPRLLIVGWDSATFDLVSPWVATGELPNLKRVLDGGARGGLRSTVPHSTPVAWTSFSTGVNPGKHGVFDFYQPFGESYERRITNGSFVRSETLWKYLSRNGHRVGVLNMPWTYPPEELEGGWVISGMDTPEFGPKMCSPREVFQEIEATVGSYPLNVPEWRGGVYDLGVLEKEIRSLTSVAKRLMRKRPVDVLSVVYTAPDRIQHISFKTRRVRTPDGRKVADALLHVYRLLDEALGALLEELDEDTLIVVASDHGGGPIRRLFNVYAALEGLGMVCYKDSSALGGLRSHSRRVYARARELAPGLHRRLRHMVRRRLRGKGNKLVKLTSMRFPDDVDWSRTRAFHWGTLGQIQVNLKGRELLGTVKPGAEYESVRQDIRDHLLTLRDPETEESIFKEVYLKEELYTGEALEAAPDILICPIDGCEVVSMLGGRPLFPPVQDSYFKGASMEGMHYRDGIFIAKGPGIKAEEELSAGIEDVAPTLLHYLGLPIPEHMDGRVIMDLFTGDKARRESWKEAPGPEDGHRLVRTEYSEAEEEEVERRLRDLGYLE